MTSLQSRPGKRDQRGVIVPFRRAAAAVSAIVAVAVLVAEITATWPHVALRIRIGGVSAEDRFTLFLPLALPLLALMSSVLVMKMGAQSRAVLFGIFIASSAYLILPALALATQYDLIARDGTAHWGLLFIPTFWLGLPLVFGSALLGAAIAFLRR